MAVEVPKDGAEQEREELIIKAPSPELRVRAIETLPLPIEGAEVFFTINGTVRWQGGSGDENVRKEYLRMCSEGGVIPNSTLKIETAWDTQKLFVPRNPVGISGLNGDDQVSIQTREVMIQRLLGGGKFAAIECKIGSDAPFSDFKQGYLRRIIAHGYEIDSADLALTSYRLTGYNEGTYWGTTILIGRRSISVKKYIESDAMYGALRAWFSELQGQQNFFYKIKFES